MPPSIWPSTSSGLIALPTSCAAVILDQLHRAELEVDLQLGDLRAVAVERIRFALALGIERQVSADRTSPRRGRRSHRILVKSGKLDTAGGVTLADDDRRAVQRRDAFSDTLAKRKIFSRKARPAFSAALPVTKVWREADVLPASG